MKVTVLGCGPSGGVPLIGCQCAVCQGSNLRNNRTRASILIELGDAKLLVDTSPDLRQQALRQDLSHLDAVLYTHAHADHTHGIDDLRSFNFHMKRAIPLYGSKETLDRLTQQFSYCFAPIRHGDNPAVPALEVNFIEEYDYFQVAGVNIQSFLQYHGKGKSLGYRIGNFAYSTDVDKLPEQSLQLLESLDVWLVDCLQYEPAPTHAHLARTLEWVARLKPKRAILTHMTHVFDYERLCRELPENCEPAFDGMEIDIA
ncbi:MAG: MBL fold metallo-hydrolase [Rickettsiales bacterium]